MKIYNILVFILAQTPHTLRITPDSSIHSTQYANFEIVGTLKIELLDVNGYRVTSGPDSELVSNVFFLFLIPL